MNKEKTVTISTIDKLMIVLIWIGLWGISDNIMDKYIAADNYNLRIFIYFIILIAAIATIIIFN